MNVIGTIRTTSPINDETIAMNAVSARKGGTLTYLTGIVPHLLKFSQYNFLIICGKDQDEFTRALPDSDRLRMLRLPTPPTSAARALWQQTVLARALRRVDYGLLFSPNNYTVLAEAARVPIVLAIRNSNLFVPPPVEYAPPLRISSWVVRQLSRISARTARRVVFVSKFSRDVFTESLGIPTGKTRVVYHGRSQEFAPTAAASDLFDQPYILSVSNIYPHKNYPTLIEAFGLLKHRSDTPHQLVIVGSTEFKREVDRIRNSIAEQRLSDHVVLAGYLPHRDLPGVYANSDLFVFPSLLESFGHPLVEAMAMGVPVAASRAAAIPEICNTAPRYFDAADPGDMAATMADVLTDGDLRARMKSQGVKRASFFSWEKTARNLLSVFREALDEGGKREDDIK